MTWFLIAIAGNFLNAVVGITDKFLLGQRAVIKPQVYTFYIGLLSIFALILAPFGLIWPGLWQFFISLLAGAMFFLGLFYFFKALDIGESSRVFPVVGGLVPVLVFFFSFIFFGGRLSAPQMVAFFLLVSGSVLISIGKNGIKINSGKYFKFIALSVLLAAVSLVLTKYVFNHQNFISGFIWTRLGSFLAAVLFLIPSRLRHSILSAGRQAKTGLSALLVFNKSVAGLASVLINFAISRADVSLIKALEGSQYVFLFFLTIVLSKKFPQIVKEKISRQIFLQKILAILFISSGIIVLAICSDA